MNIDIINGLNDAQKEAVTTTEGYVRVIAGAGSGKTSALVNRYIYLVKNLGISTSNILCVTFTNKAAKEMKKRIRSVIGDYDTGLISTFHGFCRFLLKDDIHRINYPNNFIVIDTEDINSILKIVYEQANISSREYTFSKAKEYINFRKNSSNEYISYLLDMDNSKLKEKFLFSNDTKDRIFFGYLYQQKKNYNLDYSDLILFTLYILENYPDVKNKWQEKLQYIMVDEFQDVNSNQYNLVDILSSYHKNLFVVGDPDQTIYSWRGAKINFILNFDKYFKNTKTIVMNINYRSSKNILNASNSLISKNQERFKKDLIATKINNIPVIYNHCKNIYDESKWILNEVKKLIEQGKSYNDIVILYRAHYISRSIEECFLRNKIPYKLYSGIEFYQRKEIKDIISYLRMIVFEDDLSFIRVVNEPKRNFGKKRMEIITKYSEDNNCSLYNSLKINVENNLISKSKVNEFINLIEKYKKIYKEMKLTDLITELLNKSGYEAILRQSGEDERLNNLAEFKNSINDYENSAGEETSLENYLQEIALLTNIDTKDNTNVIKMMTLHTSKGLEFPYVFICGLNEGIFPSYRTKTKEEMEEERRLAYVGYTRAQDALFLSDAEGINFNRLFRYPSRFIFNTDKKYLKYNIELEESLLENTSNFINDSENYLNTDYGIKKDIKKSNKNFLLENSKEELAVDSQEKDKLEKLRLELDSQEKDRLEKLRLELDSQEKDRLEKLRLELDSQEKDRLEKLRLELDSQEKDRLKKLRLELDSQEKDRLEKLRLELDFQEKDRLEKLRLELDSQEKDRLKKLRLELDSQEKDRLKKLRLELDSQEKDRLEKLRLELDSQEKDRLKKLRLELDSQEKDRLEKLKLEAKKILKIKNEIYEQEKILYKNKHSFFGKYILYKKNNKTNLKELYSQLSEMLK
ncbi:UvrD-helicase domain-containing protein [Clostridium perfringens]|uniref:UvrD-helicase domain-containing protein n=1 Tax=Clostridium perfringens TaxID=1502 RepID=UPI002468816C|nr:UvrD-helicase domain-containing protein [Clostridium perfringens]MDH5086594.1 ATP-dependent DNA helicase PcrA [Clostridium perfringens]